MLCAPLIDHSPLPLIDHFSNIRNDIIGVKVGIIEFCVTHLGMFNLDEPYVFTNLAYYQFIHTFWPLNLETYLLEYKLPYLWFQLHHSYNSGKVEYEYLTFEPNCIIICHIGKGLLKLVCPSVSNVQFQKEKQGLTNPNRSIALWFHLSRHHSNTFSTYVCLITMVTHYPPVFVVDYFRKWTESHLFEEFGWG